MIEDDYTEEELTEILQGRGAYSKLPESEQEYIRRWDDLRALQDHYILFKTFMKDCFLEIKGFETDRLQEDIADFMQSKIRLKMVQAQRGQAKSMIAGAYAVWRLIKNPSTRVLIVSAGADVADEIAKWVKLIIDSWDILECMRPDKQHGDRTSAVAFDINWMLKGPDKSPSVRSIGITSNMQGRRADLLIPDDIESSQNSQTPTQRENLLQLSRDFTSICNVGDILYLGTPQTSHSIYNSLEERGYTVRIWPGRYPTLEEEAFYGSKLAPWIKKQIEMMPSLQSGGGVGLLRGQPTSKLIKNEEQLTADEIDKGAAYFDLQVMLNTSTADKGKYLLKTKNLIILDVNKEKGPGDLIWMPDNSKRYTIEAAKRHELYLPHAISEEFFGWEGKMMAIDPAGGSSRGDETVAMVSYLLHGYVHIPEFIASRGGYSPNVFLEIAELAFRNGVWIIEVEKNFGDGAFGVMLRPVLRRYFLEQGLETYPEVIDIHENQQKEKRILGILEPVMARHKLVLSPEVIQYDRDSLKNYSDSEKEHFSLLNQMSQLMDVRGCLVHDDRIDALCAAVRYWMTRLNVIARHKIAEKNKEDVMITLSRFLRVKESRGGAINNRKTPRRYR